MNDRLDELRRLSHFALKSQNFNANHSSAVEDEQDAARVALLSGESTDADSPVLTFKQSDGQTEANSMQDFFRKVSVIKLALREISVNVDLLYRLKQSLLHTVSPEKESDTSCRINEAIENNVALVSKTKSALEAMRMDNNDIFQYNCNTAEVRIRKNIHNGLVKKFRDNVQEFRVIQAKYKQQVKQKAARQIKLVYPEATEEDVDCMLENGDMSATAAFQSCIVEGRESFESALVDLRSKSEDLRKLERGVQDLHQLFVELAEFVNLQEEAIDHIELSVSQTKDYSDQTHIDLLRAKKYRDASNQRFFYGTVMLLLFAIFVLIPSLLRLIGAM